MNRITLPRAQRGVTLVVGLIMLVLITLMVTSAFMLSNTNLKAVGNMQFRDEAIAAANAAIETVLGTSLESTNTEVDIGGIKYQVAIATPTCIRAAIAFEGAPSSEELPMSMSSNDIWNTVWDIEAAVTDPRSGTSVRVHQGVRVLLPNAQKITLCP